MHHWAALRNGRPGAFAEFAPHDRRPWVAAFTIAVMVVVAMADLVAVGKAPSKVCLNNFNPLHRHTDLPLPYPRLTFVATALRFALLQPAVAAVPALLQPLPYSHRSCRFKLNHTPPHLALAQRLRLPLGFDIKPHLQPPVTTSNLSFHRPACASSPASSTLLQL